MATMPLLERVIPGDLQGGERSKLMGGGRGSPKIQTFNKQPNRPARGPRPKARDAARLTKIKKWVRFTLGLAFANLLGKNWK